MTYNQSSSASTMVPPMSPIPYYETTTVPGDNNQYYTSTSHFVTPTTITPSLLSNPFSFDETYNYHNNNNNHQQLLSTPVSPMVQYPFSQPQSPNRDVTSMYTNTTTINTNTNDHYRPSDGNQMLYKSNQQAAREYSANMKALELLDATVGVDVRNVSRPIQQQQQQQLDSHDLTVVTPTATTSWKQQQKFCRENRHGTSSSTTKALMLLQETVGGDVSCIAVPKDDDIVDTTKVSSNNHKNVSNDNAQDRYQNQYDAMNNTTPYNESVDDTNHNNKIDTNTDDTVTTFKNGFDIVRERGANMKALALLEATVGHDISDVAKATSVYLHPVVPTKKLTPAEESYQLRKQLKAEYKAKKRMEQELEEQQRMMKDDTDMSSKNHDDSGSSSQPWKETKEEMTSQQVRQKMIAEYKAKKKLDEIVGTVPIAPEAMAESTRQKTTTKIVNDDDGGDVYDTETINAMKCNMDIERENMARKRALQLLNERPGLMA